MTTLAVSGNCKHGRVFSAVMQPGGIIFGGRRVSVLGGIVSVVGGKHKICRYGFGGNATRLCLFWR